MSWSDGAARKDGAELSFTGKFGQTAELEVMQYLRNRERDVFRSERDPERSLKSLANVAVGRRWVHAIEFPTSRIAVGLRPGR